MPSPIGHALGGVVVALAGRGRTAPLELRRFLTDPLTLWSIGLAALPDADLLVPGFHRTVTHSVTATLAVTILAIVVTRWVTHGRQSAVASPPSPVRSRRSAPGRRQSAVASRQSPVGGRQSGLPWAVVLTCAAAHASHLLLDWLGEDRSQPAGIQMLWPWSDRWFISGWDLFPRIERRGLFSAASIAINVNALVWELLLLGPIVAALWWRGRRKSPRRSGRSGRSGGSGG